MSHRQVVIITSMQSKYYSFPIHFVTTFHTHHSDITFQAINLLKRREVRNNSVNYDKLLSLQLDYLRRSSCEIFDIMPQLENNQESLSKKMQMYLGTAAAIPPAKVKSFKSLNLSEDPINANFSPPLTSREMPNYQLALRAGKDLFRKDVGVLSGLYQQPVQTHSVQNVSPNNKYYTKNRSASSSCPPTKLPSPPKTPNPTDPKPAPRETTPHRPHTTDPCSPTTSSGGAPKINGKRS